MKNKQNIYKPIKFISQQYCNILIEKNTIIFLKNL